MSRPPLYKTPEELENKIEEYFKGGMYKRKIITKMGVEVEVPCITVTDLVLFLGFSDRRSFYDYENKEEFTHIIKRARTMLEREYEMLLISGLGSGAIFGLKQFGWSDNDAPLVDNSTHLHFTKINDEDLIEQARARGVNLPDSIAGRVGAESKD